MLIIIKMIVNGITKTLLSSQIIVNLSRDTLTAKKNRKGNLGARGSSIPDLERSSFPSKVRDEIFLFRIKRAIANEP